MILTKEEIELLVELKEACYYHACMTKDYPNRGGSRQFKKNLKKVDILNRILEESGYNIDGEIQEEHN